MNVTLEDAYDEACRQIGHLSVERAVLERHLAQVTAERDEAGVKIVELTAEQQTD